MNSKKVSPLTGAKSPVGRSASISKNTTKKPKPKRKKSKLNIWGLETEDLKFLKKYPNKTFTMIPNHIIVKMMGEESWAKVMGWIKKKFPKTKSVLISHTAKGPFLVANSPKGQRIGYLADIAGKAFKMKKV